MRCTTLLFFTIMTMHFGSTGLVHAAESNNAAPRGEITEIVVPASAPTNATIGDQLWATRYETAALFSGITVIGLKNWKWGSSTHFRTHSEGWFVDDSGSGGADKLGHAFTSYAFTNILSEAIETRAPAAAHPPLTAAMITMGLMTYVELFDGYSMDHGFSYEDMIMNTSGTAFAVLRRYVPSLRDTLDYRLEYQPSGYGGAFKPFSDYSGQRYLLALKLGGFESLRATTLRFLELHGGYYTRGYLEAEEAKTLPHERRLYAGIGLNLGELLFGRSASDKGGSAIDRTGRAVFEHVQFPGTVFH